MIAFTEIVGCNGTVIYSIVAKDMSFFTSGRLQLHIAYDGMLLLRLNEFEYSINGSQKILFDRTDPQFSLVIYLKKYPSDVWIIKMNQNTDAVFSCLSEKCHMKDKHESFKRQEKKDEQSQQPSKKKKTEVLIEQQQLPQKTQKQTSIYVDASKQLSKGLKFTGGLISKGISSLGGFIAKKVPQKQEVQVTQNTKENIKLATKTTKNVLQFASAQVGNLFKFGKEVASDVGERFSKSEKGKQLQENYNIESFKEGAKTGAGVISNVYEGVVGAVYSVGSGVAKGVGKVIGARYGHEAGEAADQAFQGAGNAIKILRVPQDQLANTLK